MNTNELSPQRFLAWAGISFIVFFLSWYDTTHAHFLTQGMNDWIQNTLYVPPITEDMPQLQIFYRETLEAITGLGSYFVFVFGGAMILLDLLLRREFKLVGYCLFIIFGVVLAVLAIKLLVYSPRPVFPLAIHSFPSGHTARAALWCGLMSMLSHKQIFKLSPHWQWVWLSIPCFVAFSRLALGDHWFTDVIGSLSLTAGVFLITYYYIEKNNQSR